MEEFQTYAPEEVILENLEELSQRGFAALEQELAHLRELAEEIVRENADGETDPSAFLASLPEHRLPPPAALPPGAQLLAFAKADSTRRRALLAIELCRRLPKSHRQLQEALFPLPEKQDFASWNRISYQKNNYTDLAYECFSALLPEPRAAYAHGFASVCEDVYNGFSEYCILPIENSAEGRLNSFSRLIAEYELKIAATCEIETGEERITRFALLRRTAVRLTSPVPCPVFFECLCELGDYPEASDILTAARNCGLTAAHAELSIPARELQRQQLHIMLSANEGNLSAFLLYLAMEVPSAGLLGLYPHLSQRKKR